MANSQARVSLLLSSHLWCICPHPLHQLSLLTGRLSTSVVTMWPEGGQHLRQPIPQRSQHHPGWVRTTLRSPCFLHAMVCFLGDPPGCTKLSEQITGHRLSVPGKDPHSMEHSEDHHCASPQGQTPAPLSTAGAAGVAKKNTTQSSTACSSALLTRRRDTARWAPTVIPHGQQVPKTEDTEQFTHARPSCAAIERQHPLPSKDRYNRGVGQMSCDAHASKKDEEHSLSLKQGKAFPHVVMS